MKKSVESEKREKNENQEKRTKREEQEKKEGKRKNKREKENDKESISKISSTKARGVITLILLLLLFQIVTFILHKGFGDSSIKKSHIESFSNKDANKIYYENNEQLFEFDPNTISLDSLILLGFSQKQAQTLLNYRDKGGKFRKREDFAKIYSVSEYMYKRLEPYIVIQENYIKSAENESDNRLKDENEINKRLDTKRKSDKKWSAEKKMGKSVTVKGKDKVSGENGREGKKEKIKVAERSEFKRIEINSADSVTLLSVRGIGPYYAHQIILYREKLGGFANIEQILEIKRMNEENYHSISEQVIIDKKLIIKLSLKDLSSENISNLYRHPYIGKSIANNISLYIRSLSKDSLQSLSSLQILDALVENNLVSAQTREKLFPYMAD